MKLLVVLLCLLSERYFVHSVSYTRFYWFNDYYHYIYQYLAKREGGVSPALLLIFLVLSPVLLCGLVLFIASDLIFGILGFILHLAILYYCLGPTNPFYPIHDENAEKYSEAVVGNYFAAVNGQLFSVVFWYIILGPVGAMLYRLISLSIQQPPTAVLAQKIIQYFDWIPARLTVLLYLLVGNFQRGLHYFRQQFLTAPENNDQFLKDGGLLAAQTQEKEPVQLPQAESLVEHALVVFLVLLAFLTLIA